ncbi:hypothetical protein KAJ27_10055 [bacterium]|nr:hypothetical protein [bacterium]
MKEMSYLEMNEINGGNKLAIGCAVNGFVAVFFPNPASAVFGLFCVGYGLGELVS